MNRIAETNFRFISFLVSAVFLGLFSLTASGAGVKETRVISLTKELNYGEVPFGASRTRTLAIRNAGNSPLKVTKIVLPSGFSGSFSGSIPAGGTQKIAIDFKPTAAKAYSGTLSVSSNKTSGSTSASLSARGIATRTLAVSGKLSFGKVRIGGSKTAVLTLKNTGNSPLKVTKITYPVGFSGNYVGTIPAGGSQKVTVTFKPTAAKSYSGNLNVASNKMGGTSTLALSGTGSVTRVMALSGSLAFGNVAVGSSKTTKLTIRNTGDSPLSVTKITYPAGFSGNYAGTIPAGGSQKVTVTFKPTAVQACGGNLKVTSDATSGINTLAVSGGVPVSRIISMSDELPFGGVELGRIAKANLTICNLGNSPLTVTKITCPEGFSGSFSGVIAPGKSAVVDITFQPTEMKSYSGIITVASDRTEGPASIYLSASGYRRILDFIRGSEWVWVDPVEVGTSRVVSIPVGNSGNKTLEITKITPPEGFSVESFPKSLVPIRLASIELRFKPTRSGLYSGEVKVASTNTSGEKSFSVSMTAVAAKHLVIEGEPLWLEGVNVGESKRSIFTISNEGTKPLTVEKIEFPEGFTGEFSGVIEPGRSKEVVVTFSPSEAKEYAGWMHVISDKTEGEEYLRFQSRGIGARFLSIYGSVDFGKLIEGYRLAHIFTLMNTGYSSLQLELVANENGGFAWEGFSGVLKPGESRGVKVTFAPRNVESDEQLFNDYFRFNFTEPMDGWDSPIFTGVGIDSKRDLQVEGDISTFGEVSSGNSVSRLYIVRNTGKSPLEVVNFEFPKGFTGAGFSGGIIPPGESRELTVTFAPTQGGEHHGYLRVSTADQVFEYGPLSGYAPEVRRLSVKGKGVFGFVLIGSSRTHTITVQNVGNYPLVLEEAAPIEGFEFGDLPDEPLGIGESRDIELTFRPTEVAYHSGYVQFLGNDFGQVSSLQVTGHGVNAIQDFKHDKNGFSYILSTDAAGRLLLAQYDTELKRTWHRWVSQGNEYNGRIFTNANGEVIVAGAFWNLSDKWEWLDSELSLSQWGLKTRLFNSEGELMREKKSRFGKGYLAFQEIYFDGNRELRFLRGISNVELLNIDLNVDTVSDLVEKNFLIINGRPETIASIKFTKSGGLALFPGGGSDRLRVLDRDYQTVLWQQSLGFSPTGEQLLDSQGNIILNVGNGFLVKYDGADGAMLWRTDTSLSAPLIPMYGRVLFDENDNLLLFPSAELALAKKVFGETGEVDPSWQDGNANHKWIAKFDVSYGAGKIVTFDGRFVTLYDSNRVMEARDDVEAVVKGGGRVILGKEGNYYLFYPPEGEFPRFEIIYP